MHACIVQAAHILHMAYLQTCANCSQRMYMHAESPFCSTLNRINWFSLLADPNIPTRLIILLNEYANIKRYSSKNGSCWSTIHLGITATSNRHVHIDYKQYCQVSRSFNAGSCTQEREPHKIIRRAMHALMQASSLQWVFLLNSNSSAITQLTFVHRPIAVTKLDKESAREAHSILNTALNEVCCNVL